MAVLVATSIVVARAIISSCSIPFLTPKKPRGRLLGPLLLGLALLAAALFGEEAKTEAGEEVKSPAADFVLTVRDNRLSLNAKKASLAQLLAEIGRRMNIEVVGQIPAQEKVTLAFDRLSLEEALQRLSNYANFVYLKSAEEEPGQIIKIMIFPKPQTTGLSGPAAKESELKQEPIEGAPRPKPFTFEFDPSQPPRK